MRLPGSIREARTDVEAQITMPGQQIGGVFAHSLSHIGRTWLLPVQGFTGHSAPAPIGELHLNQGWKLVVGTIEVRTGSPLHHARTALDERALKTGGIICVVD